MKRLLSVLLTLIPFVALAAPVTLTWDPYPTPTATMHAECKKTTETNYRAVGQSLATGSITAESGVNAGESGTCRTWTTEVGKLDSPRSGDAAFSVPFPQLPAPTGVRAVP